MRTLVPMAIALSTPFNLVTVAEDFGAILAQLGRDRDAATLLGAADATAAEMGNARREAQANEMARRTSWRAVDSAATSGTTPTHSAVPHRSTNF